MVLFRRPTALIEGLAVPCIRNVHVLPRKRSLLEMGKLIGKVRPTPGFVQELGPFVAIDIGIDDGQGSFRINGARSAREWEAKERINEHNDAIQEKQEQERVEAQQGAGLIQRRQLCCL